ncbi:asparagine synthase (glutamine-hydrolyzing) [Wenyingzhuangia sp. IMCC45533]
MCGINGVYTNAKNLNLDPEIHRMNERIFHRGPDEYGVYIENSKDYSLAMGMRRLSIIDVQSGKQPIYSRDKNQIIVFNGEVYNYKVLKKKLLDKGVEFETNSDTEVIMRLYEEYGTASFSMLDGMYGFSIYDKKEDKIYIARDFFGEKPMYYCHKENSLLWGSELKSIVSQLRSKPEISHEALSLYFQLTYIPAPYTIYTAVKKLEANSFLEFDCKTQEAKINTIRYEDVIDYDKKMSFEKAKRVTENLVNETVNSRTVSDVPIGTFLSGGVDSSIISMCLSNNSNTAVDTFSIGFQKKSFDESDKAKLVSKLIGSNHHEFKLSDKDMLGDVDSILLNYDEPFADPSALPTFMVSKLTSQHVKVALTGDGGDEVFGGYNKYYMGKMNNIYTGIVPQKLHHKILINTEGMLKDKSDSRGIKFKLRRLLKAINYEEEFYYNIISLGFQKKELDYLINDESKIKEILDYYKSKNVRTLKDFREVDRNISLEGALLTKVDRASMLASIECRSPFLNKKLWDFTNQLPDDFLLKGWNKKYLLKKTFDKYFPEKFLDKSKKGFAVPVGDWLRSVFSRELRSYIDASFIERQDLFQTEYIRELVINHLSGKEDNTYRVWTYFCFQKWYVNIYDNGFNS